MQLRALTLLVCLLAALVASAPSAEILEDRWLPEAEEVEATVGLSKAVNPDAGLSQLQQAFDAETDSIVPEHEEVLVEAVTAIPHFQPSAPYLRMKYGPKAVPTRVVVRI